MLDLLNENLRGKLIVYFNGRIATNIPVLNYFPLEIVSSLSLILNKKIFSIYDNILIEGELGNELCFIVTGRINLIHRKTKTLIKELN